MFSLCGTWTDSASTRGCADESLSTLEVQHLFKQIKFSYFTFDALNFLLTKSLIEPHSLFSHFSQSSIIDLE